MARKVILLDALMHYLGVGRLNNAERLWAANLHDLVSLRQVADTLLALACVWISGVIFRSYWGRRPPGRPTSKSVWALSSFLVLCGFSQFAGVLVNYSGRSVGIAFDTGGGRVLGCGADFRAAGRTWRRFRKTPRATIAKSPSGVERKPRSRRSEAQARKLAEADARKNEFLAMLGHELRNPLAPIRNAVKIMKQRGSDDPEMCWARDVVDHQVRHLGQLVDDLLEISRVTSGKVRLQKEAVDVATIVAFAVETSRPTIEVQHHRLSISVPADAIFVDADSIRIAQVISNLLNNAAKYTQVRRTDPPGRGWRW